MFVFGVSLLLSSSLLFLIQPVVGKIVTAQFGGGAQIWSLSLFFFQLILFLGYLFSFIILKLDEKKQIILFLGLVIIGFFFSQVPSYEIWAPANFESPVSTLLKKYFLYLSIPCFILGCVSTLLQKWFYKLNWGEPYFLYSISNWGSLTCLILYPFLIEPYLSINSTLKLWTVLFFICLCLLIVSSIIFYKKLSPTKQEFSFKKPSFKQMATWLSISSLGTMLLVSTTHHLTRDIAPIPFLWLLPLLIYLMSFSLNFKSHALYNKNNKSLFIVLAHVMCILTLASTEVNLQSICSNILLFFLGVNIIHGELFEQRGSAENLQYFYLMIAFGGMLGTLLINFIVPLFLSVNNDIYIVLTLFLLFTLHVFKTQSLRLFFEQKLDRLYKFTIIIFIIAINITLFNNKYIYHERNHYGSVSIEQVTTNDGKKFHKMVNGRILHGYQPLDVADRNVPTSYYHINSPLSLAFDALRTQKENLKVGLIGLGVGTAAAYLNPGDAAIFYEIDPKIIRIANEKFNYLKDAQGSHTIEQGDARVLLSREDNNKFDLILVDAFNGDAVPTHLLTLEALNIYMKHLSKNGILLFHVSNKYLTLDKIISVGAKELDVEALTLKSNASNAFQESSIYTAILPNDINIRNSIYQLLESDKFSSIVVKDNIVGELLPWKDQYSNLLSVLKL